MGGSLQTVDNLPWVDVVDLDCLECYLVYSVSYKAPLARGVKGYFADQTNQITLMILRPRDVMTTFKRRVFRTQKYGPPKKACLQEPIHIIWET